ncbi:hypothetical protein [Actinacidiphila sp. bgisy160]|uniref:hypothetical protein n=1 Tax=Actinacidiphila sp. bgisy160 TaxID=3413796 RepID=UPI003D70A1A5
MPPSDPPPPLHRATTMEKGAFSHATCVCGWRGPARRARDRARRDATEHEQG